MQSAERADLGPVDRRQRQGLNVYTQCPECSTSFHVTADVLKQAIGKVRCGGCGIAFNALEYLSEQKPTSKLIRDTDAQLPELTPGAQSAKPPAEMRFDDNTPLPDDFDIDDKLAATDVSAGDAGAREEPGQVDLALGKPEEWEELLDEVDGARAAATASAPDEIDEPLPDMDEQFAMKAEAMGIDLSGVHAKVDKAAAGDGAETSIDEDLIAAAFEVEKAGTLDETIGDDVVPDDNEVENFDPPTTKEEDTINRMIDHELLSQSKEDEHGFRSTIIGEFGDLDDLDDNPLVETIILEGDEARAEIEKKILAHSARSDDDRGFIAQARKSMRGVLDRSGLDDGASSYGSVAGVLILALILGAQIVHQSREALATMPAFSNTVGPVYRAIGRPVTPAWDITGWRFEVTKGSTDDAEELLTIYSRIGNQSDESLPYPLISVSLTDRFEEIIGSRVLEPAQYLAGDFDPRRPVPPGDTFNAVISIESPSTDATGFKLNVCYRLTNGQLRCAVDDFK